MKPSLSLGGGTLIGLGCLVLAAVYMQNEHHLAIGVLLGTLFGQTAVAASWTAFGPGRLILRLPLSLLWGALLVVSLHLGVLWHNEAPFFLGIALPIVAVEWLGVQPLVWGLAILAKLHLRHQDDPASPAAAAQFGIGQLMIFTAIVAVLLGLGRLVVASEWLGWVGTQDSLIFAFLIATAVIMNLPLLIAALLPRRTGLAIALATGFMILVWIAEMPIFLTTNLHGPDLLHMLLINTFTTSWVVSFAVMMRSFGYRFP